MRDARSLAVAGALLVGVGLCAWAVPTAQAQTTSAALATGWWTQQPLAQPVPNGGFEIDWAAEAEQAVAAVKLDTSVADGRTLFLVLHELGGSATDQARAEVCVTTDAWTPANPGAYADRPEASCATSSRAELGRDATSKEWVGDITSLASSGGTISLVVRPLGKPLGEGSPATAPFSVQFSSAALRVEDAAPSATTTTPTTTAPTDSGGTGTDYYVAPEYPYPEVGNDFTTPPFVTSEPPAVTTETTSGRSLEEQYALGPVDVTDSGGRPWGRVLVLTPLSAGLGTLAAAARRWVSDRGLASGQA